MFLFLLENSTTKTRKRLVLFDHPRQIHGHLYFIFRRQFNPSDLSEVQSLNEPLEASSAITMIENSS